MSTFSRQPQYGYNDVIYNIQGRIIALENMNATIPEKLANLATKAELKEVEGILRSELKEVETNLRAEIKEVETNLRAEIKEVEGNLRVEINEVNNKIDVFKGELNTTIQKEQKELRGWLLGIASIIIAAIGVAIGVISYFGMRQPTVFYVPQGSQTDIPIPAQISAPEPPVPENAAPVNVPETTSH